MMEKMIIMEFATARIKDGKHFKAEIREFAFDDNSYPHWTNTLGQCPDAIPQAFSGSDRSSRSSPSTESSEYPLLTPCQQYYNSWYDFSSARPGRDYSPLRDVPISPIDITTPEDSGITTENVPLKSVSLSFPINDETNEFQFFEQFAWGG
jgi:hypothetical protein